MKKMKYKFLLPLVLFFCGNAMAQDINFSQFYELPLLRNPALAGIFRGDIRATSAFRSQWASVTTPYKTMALGTEMKFNLKNSDNYLSVGMQVTEDMAGDSKFSKTQIMPVLAFHKSMSSEKDAYLSVGFLGGPVQQKFDATKMTFSDQFVNGVYSSTNPTSQNLPRSNYSYMDGTVGLNFSSSFSYDIQYYIGAAMFHFGEPKVAFQELNDVRLNRKFVFNAGLSAPFSEYDKVILYADYFMQGGHRQAQGGVLLKHDLFEMEEGEGTAISFGGFYRWNDALVPVVKLDYYRLGVGLTYDVNMSKLKNASHVRGGFELTVSFKSFLNIRNSSVDKVRCPVGLEW
jgi:type IX secretion system PorP/SprF family membrane protein